MAAPAATVCGMTNSVEFSCKDKHGQLVPVLISSLWLTLSHAHLATVRANSFMRPMTVSSPVQFSVMITRIVSFSPL